MDADSARDITDIEDAVRNKRDRDIQQESVVEARASAQGQRAKEQLLFQGEGHS